MCLFYPRLLPFLIFIQVHSSDYGKSFIVPNSKPFRMTNFSRIHINILRQFFNTLSKSPIYIKFRFFSLAHQKNILDKICLNFIILYLFVNITLFVNMK